MRSYLSGERLNSMTVFSLAFPNIYQNVWILTYQYFMWSIRTSIRDVVKSQKLHFKRFVTAGLLSSFFCKSKCIEDVGCSIILTLCCSPPGWNLGCDIGLAGVTGASLTFFFGLAPEFGVVAAPEIHQRILTFKTGDLTWETLCTRPPLNTKKIGPTP